MFQFTNSPFSNLDILNLFAYSLAWQGEWDCYNSYWTVNMWEYNKGQFVKALNLGNRFYAGDFTFDLDYSTRCTDLKAAFTKDFTVNFMPAYEWEWGRAFAKIGFEKVALTTYVSPTEEDPEISLVPEVKEPFTGTNFFYGAGVEFFPLKSYKDVRVHAIWASNSHITAGHYINIGLTWKLHLTSAAKAIFNKNRND